MRLYLLLAAMAWSFTVNAGEATSNHHVRMKAFPLPSPTSVEIAASLGLVSSGGSYTISKKVEVLTVSVLDFLGATGTLKGQMIGESPCGSRAFDAVYVTLPKTMVQGDAGGATLTPGRETISLQYPCTNQCSAIREVHHEIAGELVLAGTSEPTSVDSRLCVAAFGGTISLKRVIPQRRVK